MNTNNEILDMTVGEIISLYLNGEVTFENKECLPPFLKGYLFGTLVHSETKSLEQVYVVRNYENDVWKIINISRKLLVILEHAKDLMNDSPDNILTMDDRLNIKRINLKIIISNS